MTNEKNPKKPMDVTSSKDLSSSVKTFGDPDAWQLICKASSSARGWMRSTKAMEVPGLGCLVQVSTQYSDHVAEAVCFVPSATVKTDEAGMRRLAADDLMGTVLGLANAHIEKLSKLLGSQEGDDEG